MPRCPLCQNIFSVNIDNTTDNELQTSIIKKDLFENELRKYLLIFLKHHAENNMDTYYTLHYNHQIKHVRDNLYSFHILLTEVNTNSWIYGEFRVGNDFNMTIISKEIRHS